MGPEACSDLAASIQMLMCIQNCEQKYSESERLISLVGNLICASERSCWLVYMTEGLRTLAHMRCNLVVDGIPLLNSP